MESEPLRVPADYIPGYERARQVDPLLASVYVGHTLIGDPLADALVSVFALQRGGFQHLLARAMNGDKSAFQEGPKELSDFFASLEEKPAWATGFEPGIRAFHRNSDLILQGLVGGSLVEGFSTNIARSFVITGRLREQGVRRLRQNNRHVLEIFMPGGLERHGDGFKLSVRLRLVHAEVRRLLNGSPEDWDTAAWGTPLSAAHMGFAGAAFSARCLKHARSLGVRLNKEESESFMSVWRYALWLMGIPEAILPRNEDESLRLFRIGTICEPPPDFESIIMANALINAAPAVLGVESEDNKKALLKLAYSVSRALIGDELADKLKYPKRNNRMLLAGVRTQARVDRAMGLFIPGYARRRRLSNFGYLVSAAAYDEAGISYEMPDHLYAERSTRW